jgi:glycosyltransferase involved in cell wall biosynthesis
LFRSVVYDVRGIVRPCFDPWYVRVLQNPNSSIDPQWGAGRKANISLAHKRRISRISIVSPPATFFIAYWLRWNLQNQGAEIEIYSEMPVEFSDDIYFVVCAQVFNKLPPRDKRIIYQMEQSVTLRWFNQEYIDVLYNSVAVFDYSLVNVEYMRSLKSPLENLYHVPIQALNRDLDWLCIDGKLVPSENFDVIFYGDIKNLRRQKFFKALSGNFNLKLITNLYGFDLWRSLLGAKVVVNIHYYENALLETTRICECLSLGIKVVSEVGSDQSQYIGHFPGVTFTPVDDIDAMVNAVRELLNYPVLIPTEDSLFKYKNRSLELTDALREININIGNA